MKRVYISGALTGLAEPATTKAFYEAAAAACVEAGNVAYVPHLATDPVEYPELSARDVYILDRRQVVESDLVIAYVGFPSIGVGMEIEIAHQNGIPVLLLVEEGAPLSRMARGCPAVTGEIHFTGQEDALQQLRDWLSEEDSARRSQRKP